MFTNHKSTSVTDYHDDEACTGENPKGRWLVESKTWPQRAPYYISSHSQSHKPQKQDAVGPGSVPAKAKVTALLLYFRSRTKAKQQ